jgi:DNA-binding NtrC family response regulator
VTRLKFILVDKDRPRAAAISTALTRHGRGVTVAESLDDLVGQSAGTPASRCVVLVPDEPGAIPRILERIKLARLDAKVIAYAADPSPHSVVKAMSAGAADYLQWPCNADTIVAAANAATARRDYSDASPDRDSR